MNYVYVVSWTAKNQYYLVKKDPSPDSRTFNIIGHISDNCSFGLGSILTTIDDGTDAYEIGSHELFLVIFKRKKK